MGDPMTTPEREGREDAEGAHMTAGTAASFSATLNFDWGDTPMWRRRFHNWLSRALIRAMYRSAQALGADCGIKVI